MLTAKPPSAERRRAARLRLAHIAEQSCGMRLELDDQRERFTALREAGANDGADRVAVADGLFPTPKDLADRMASMLYNRLPAPRKAARILEPSAGTGHLIDAMDRAANGGWGIAEGGGLWWCETCPRLVTFLRQEYRGACTQVGGDFLRLTAEDVKTPFDGCVMNPPFRRGTDIRHILHAKRSGVLKRGAPIVALCYDGAKQREVLIPESDRWESLGPALFRSAGTDAPVMLLVLHAD